MGITCLLFFIFYMLDQITKYVAQLYNPQGMRLIPGIVTCETYYNTGMAWSLLEDNTWILVVISIAASMLLGYFCIKNDWKRAKLSSVSLTMAFAGCVGNLFDRTMTIIPNSGRYGVVDMISFEPLNWISRLITGHNFPVFNLADAFLVVGIILYGIDLAFFAEKRKIKYEKAKRN